MPGSNSACGTPFGQTIRVTSTLVRVPRPTCTDGPVIVCFCTRRPDRTSTSPPMPNELIALIAGGALRARPDHLVVVAARAAAVETHGLPADSPTRSS